MKKLTSLIALAAALGMSLNTGAQILVGPTGVGPITFDASPTLPVTEWSTRNGGIVGTSATTYSDANSVEAGIQTITAAAQNVAFPVDNNYGTDDNARHNATAGHIYTQTTGADVALLMATLRNNTTDPLSHITVSYDFSTAGTPSPAGETSPGHVAFFSTNGQAGSWVRIPEFTGLTADGTVAATLFVGVWVPGTDMYLLWGDDNSSTNPDGTNTIDNFLVSNPVITNAVVPLAATLLTPANNQYFISSSLNPANVQMTATAVGSTAPTSVTFFVDGVSSFVDTTAPYSNTVALAIGTHTIFARAANATETVDTATHTITVRDEFIHFTGSTLTENFDGMGTTNGVSPVGWYVGIPSSPLTFNVTAGDGSAGSSAAVNGWNYGTTPDRALGTAPTGADRNMVVRIQNNTPSSMTAVSLNYDGEVWRNYTNDIDGTLTNFVSVDQGATWVETTFNFSQPTLRAQPQGAVDGNAVGNFTPGIGGTFTLPSPVAPNGVVYIRWHDTNGPTVNDGGLAIDNFTFTATLDVFTPTVTISSPANGSSFAFAAPVTISAAPSMANPVTNVTFYNNNLSTVITNDTTAPFSITVNNFSIGNHTLFVIAQDNSGARATNTATVTITINPNVPPSVTITNPPVLPTEMLVGGNVTVGAVPADSDGSIFGVEFYVNGVRRGTNDVTSAYSMEIGNLTAGLNLISAVAIDNAGGRGTSSFSITVTNPPGATALVTNGSDWKYFDTGTDPGATWRDFTYNDSAWLTGIAELGYGDANGRPEITVINGGVTPNFFATTYFRKKFDVANPASVSSLMLRIMKDDHAIVYLNGTKIFSDVTNEVVTFQSYVPGAVTGDGAIYEVTNNIPGSLLQAQNILAVEVHQASADSSDVSFDLMLFSEAGGASGPRLTITQTSPTQATLAWGADATGYTLYGGPSVPFSLPAWTTIGSPIAGAGSTTVDTSTGMRFFVLRNP